ncbi:hypothetical protein [Altericroceibacterium xinjiangense]|uniref:hypothetical protein n=1 Tax=Altericroceibacterium xinjiangense TaxID=762261 RepID=UPI000F7F1DBB|nr:hypothetical protein [Altericroceibacterium xinjiangense]
MADPVSRPNTKWIWLALIALLAVVLVMYLFVMADADDASEAIAAQDTATEQTGIVPFEDGTVAPVVETDNIPADSAAAEPGNASEPITQ